MVASLAALWVILVLLSELKEAMMRNLMKVGAAVAVCAMLAGCAGQSFIRPDPKLSPSIQAKQAETAQGFYEALGNRLLYCTITGTLDLTLKASPDAGLANTAGLACPAKPWDAAPGVAPVSDPAAVQKLVDAAVAKALEAYTSPPKP